MASGDLGISHMGYCSHGCSNWIVEEGALSPELDNLQFGSRTGKLSNHQVEAFGAEPI